MVRTVAEIDWQRWQPQERATLCFVLRAAPGTRELMLMRKKRGLGAGKIVAPGGRLEPGETPRDCAVREVEEELCITPTGVSCAGEHRFQFLDGYAIHVFVFRAEGFRGEPAETDEGRPLWTPEDRIPYGEMWEDNAFWLPLLLAGQPFSGRWVFEDDRVLDHALEDRFAPPAWNAS